MMAGRRTIISASPPGVFPQPGIDAAFDGRSNCAAARPAYARGTAGNALRLLFAAARRSPWLLLALRPIAPRLAFLGSRSLVSDLQHNARRILGPHSTAAQRKRLSIGVVRSFFDFIRDLAFAVRATPSALRGRIESVEGEPAYRQTRSSRRGAVLVTAHMGSFEVGLAALVGVEKRVHVVFKRDAFDAFEAMRSRCRAMLGAIESPIDDGIDGLMRLRDALLADEVVVMQGDRAMPGQRSVIVPFLHGHMRLPDGPVRLARLTGSPLVPVFVTRAPARGFRVYLGVAIEPGDAPADSIDPAVLAIAREIELAIRSAPDQWLMLNRAFVEDEEPANE